MKRSFLFYLLIMIFGLTFCVSNSFALGLGITYGTGSGSGEFDPDASYLDDYEYDSSDSNAPAFDTDTSYSGFGVVLDSNVSRDDLFNYRLDLQYGTFTYEYGSDVDLDQFTMDHTFGFRLYRNELVRIWLGPQIRLSYASGDYKNIIDYTQFGFGIAPVVGINFNPGKVVSPALTVGYRYQGIYGTREGGGIDDDYTATDSGLFLNLTLLFRLNE